MTNQAVAILAKKFGGELLPDNKQWTNRFSIKSETFEPLVHNRSEQVKRDVGLFLHGMDSLPSLQASGLGSAHVGEMT